MKIKDNLVFVFILVTSFYLNAQNLLPPDLKTSFGNNSHTNRDISYFTHTDSNDDVISISTTERDSTFTDISITKLDSNLDKIWQKTRSFDTGLSYDIPLNFFVDQNNNTYIVVRSASNESSINGFLYIIKYDQNGNEEWSINIDDYVNAYGSDFSYQKVFFENNGNFKIVYIKSNTQNSSNTNFLSFDNTGSLINSFIKNAIIPTDPSDDFTGLSMKFYYFNGDFYLKYRRHNITNNNTFYEHYIAKINSNLTEVYDLNPHINIDDTYYFNEGLFLVDQNSNIYFTYQSGDLNKYFLLKLNASGNLTYLKESPSNLNKEVQQIFLNNNNNITLLCNSKQGINSNNQVFNAIEYDNNGNVIYDYYDVSTFINGVRIYDGNILIYSNGIFKLYDENFTVLDTFQGNYNNFNDFNLTNNSSNVLVSKTTSASMYPGSDFQTKQDIEIVKIDNSQILNTYTHSGIGTSKVRFGKVVVDNSDNYIVFVHELLGPENLSIGGSDPPIKKTIYKYDSNLDFLWSLDLNNSLNNYGKNIVVDNNNDIYINTLVNYNIDNPSELVKISSNGNIIFQVSSPLSNHIFIDQNNNVGLVTPYPQYLNNSYEYYTSIYKYDGTSGNIISTYQFDNVEFIRQYTSTTGDDYYYMINEQDSYQDITPKLKLFKNGNLESETTLNVPNPDNPNMVFTKTRIDEDGSLYFKTTYNSYYETSRLHKYTLNAAYSTTILDEGFSIFDAESDKVYTIQSDGDIVNYDDALNEINNVTHNYNNLSKILKIGNYFLIKDDYYDETFVIDKNGIEVNQVNLPGSLNSSTAASDSQHNLILSNTFGNQIYTYHEYSWRRGFLHKYNFSSFNLSVNDNHVLANEFKIYPNPAKNRLHVTDLDDITKIEIFSVNGKRVLAFDNLTNNGLDISNLSNGLYLVKIQNEKSSFTKKFMKN
mgnify:CR=1 FL=1